MELEDDGTFDFIDHLIAVGALELTGIDENGEPRYLVTERCKEMYPDGYSEFMLDVGEFISRMWQIDMVDLRFEENEILVKLTENTFNKERVAEVSPEDSEQLFLIVDHYVQKRYNDIMDSGDYNE
jgi:hypothetical protein